MLALKDSLRRGEYPPHFTSPPASSQSDSYNLWLPSNLTLSLVVAYRVPCPITHNKLDEGSHLTIALVWRDPTSVKVINPGEAQQRTNIETIILNFVSGQDFTCK